VGGLGKWNVAASAFVDINRGQGSINFLIRNDRTELKTGGLKLQIFHNKFAAVPLDPAIFDLYGMPQFAVGTADPGAFGQWEVIVASP
jgi:hypothetical protein